MSNIPIREIAISGVPSSSSQIAFDDGQMKRGTVGSIADAVRPVATQTEAQAGADNAKVMTSLRVKQSIASEAGVTLQPFDSDLNSLASLATNGLIARAGAGSITTRSISGTSGQISVANPDGVAGNPVVSLSDTTVSPGTYTNANINVDQKGRITFASNGSGGSGSSVGVEQPSREYAISSFHPVTAPNFIRTAYYDSNQVAGSGAVYRNNGTSSGDLIITLLDGVTLVGFSIDNKIINASAFGLSASNTAVQNLAIIKQVIARVATDGVVYIPNLGASILVDTAGGLTNAAKIDKRIVMRVDGWLKANSQSYVANPPYMFWVTANRVVFEGSGTIEGSGTFNVGGSSTINMPGLIFCDTVTEFCYTGIRILRPPQTGIYLGNCTRAVIHNCEMSGGPTSFEMSVIPPAYTVDNPNYIGSAHFGIIATGGGDHTFSQIHFTLDEFNGRFINCIFPSGISGNSNGNKTLDCIAYYPYEKLLYGYGDNQVVSGNTVYGSGTASVDTHTEAIRLWGSDNRAFGNITVGCRGGMQILDGARNHIYGNEFKSCRATGINVQHFSPSYTGGIDSNRITDNVVTRDGASVERRFGIRVLGNDQLDFSLCEISGNTLIGWGDTSAEVEYTIYMNAPTPRVGIKNVIKNNLLQSCGNGIQLERCISSVIEGNTLHACSSIGINIKNGGRNIVQNNTGESPGAWFLGMTSGNIPSGSRFTDNFCVGATNIGIRSHVFGTNSIYADGNQWSVAPLVVPVTLSTGSSVTSVSHGGVAPHAQFMIFSASSVFAAKMAAEGYTGGANSPDFQLVNAAGQGAAASSNCIVKIIQ